MFRWLVLITFCFSCGPAKKIPEYKSAEVQLLDANHEKNYSRLPTEGKSLQTFWSNSLWTKEKNLINWRWRSSESESSDYASPYPIQVFLMTEEERGMLSPAEKFDLLMGRYEFPLKDEAFGHVESDFDSSYAGALSALFHPEPQSKTVVNEDGISIPFGSSDIKALLAYHYGLHLPKVLDSIGKRCLEGDCVDDLDPGTFHVTLTNKLGKNNEAFFIDINSTDKTEGRLIIKFLSSIIDEFSPGNKDPEGTVKVLKVLNQVTLLESTQTPSWEPSGASYLMKAYSYHLYLNLKNEIIGGKWLSSDRPDSLWILGEGEDLSGLLLGLDQLLEN